MNCNCNLAFAVHTSRTSARTAFALAARPELVEGFFEFRRKSDVQSTSLSPDDTSFGPILDQGPI